MKKRNSSVAGKIFFLAVIAMMAVLFSCKKNNGAGMTKESSMAEASQIISGEIYTGNIATSSDAKKMALDYNQGNKYIIVTKNPGATLGGISSIQSAQIIISKYGLVLKDLSNDNVFFLVNNDKESIEKFKTLESLFSAGFQRDNIFGTTVINSEKS